MATLSHERLARTTVLYALFRFYNGVELFAKNFLQQVSKQRLNNVLHAVVF